MALSLRQKVTIGALGVYWPAFFFVAHIPIPDKIRKAGVSDKCLHFVAYAILTFLLWYAVRPEARVRWRKAASWLVLAGVLVYGVLDEVSQGFVGRTCDPGDFTADLAGAVAVMVLMSFVGFRRAGLVVTGCTIFAISNVSRVNLVEVMPVASSLFQLVAYGALTAFWMDCAGLIPERGAMLGARSVAAAIGVPVVFLGVVSGSSLAIGRSVSGVGTVLALVGIAAGATGFLVVGRRVCRGGEDPGTSEVV